MSSNKIDMILQRIGERFRDDWDKIRDVQDWMEEEVFRKRVQYPMIRKKILFSWVAYDKRIRKAKNKEKMISRFLTKKFDGLFNYFLSSMFYLKEKNLILEDICDIGSNNIFFKYTYEFSTSEMNSFIELKKDFTLPQRIEIIISYFFNLIVNLFNEMITQIIDLQDSHIIMIAADVKTNPETNKQRIEFLLQFREKNSQLLKSYLRSLIYQFSEKYNIISEQPLKVYQIQKEKMIEKAVNEYKENINLIPSVILTLVKKCIVLERITPILDFFNFVCSRFEDTVFKMDEVLKTEFFPKFNLTNKEIDERMKLFNFINGNVSFFSMFQANNGASKAKQYQLFFMFMQFMFNDKLKGLKSNKMIFFPEYVDNSIKKVEENQELAPFLNNRLVYHFMLTGMEVAGMPELDYLFEYIFGINVYTMNEKLFETYLTSLNHKFTQMLSEYNMILPNNKISFEETILFFGKILYFLIDKMFIDYMKNPDKCKSIFKDKLERYTKEKVAMNIVEILFFKYIPSNDNNWADYFLSRNRSYVEKKLESYVKIPDDFFFSEARLMGINMLYERRNPDALHIGEFLILEIYQKFLLFQSKMRKKIIETAKDPNNKDEIFNIILDEISKKIVDERTIENLSEIVEWLMERWV